MAVNRRVIVIICACMMVIACTFYIISNVLPQWGSKNYIDGKVNFGLWRMCTSTPTKAYCENLRSTCSDEQSGPVYVTGCKRIPVAQAFITAACILSGLSALVLFVCGSIREDPNRGLLLIGKILLLLSLTAGITGITVGLVIVTDTHSGYKIASSAIIGIVAVIINGIATVMAMLMIR